MTRKKHKKALFFALVMKQLIKQKKILYQLRIIEHTPPKND